MSDEGYVKFQQDWRPTPALPQEALQGLIDARQQVYAQGWLGFAPALGVSFGNVSRRCHPSESGLFLITGTQTGHHAQLTGAHITTVMDYDIENNTLVSQGPVAASSESLTHAALYACDESVQAVIHVHDADRWQQMYGVWPTTDPQASYGTPEMAAAVMTLYAEQPSLASTGVIVMGGHEEGLLAFGLSLPQAYSRLLEAVNRLEES